MDGQPDVFPERCYAVERLREAQSDLSQLTQAMVVWRARVETCRTQDLTAARDAYDVLADTRKQLAEILGETQLLLMEIEEYAPAAAAGIAVAAATPVASPYEKDLSGFGDADDFEFDEID